MKQKLREVMTDKPYFVEASQTIEDAARIMRDEDIGDVLVMEDGSLCGILTDRDIIVRGVAEGFSLGQCTVGEICTKDPVSLSPDTAVDKAIEVMRERAIRRIPIIESGMPVGMISLGDLAIERDPYSALADISAAPSNSEE